MLIFILNEVLRIILPAFEVNLTQEPRTILPRLIALILAAGNRRLKDMNVLFSRNGYLRLEVFEFDG